MIRKLKNVYHLFQAVIANIIYGFPSRKLIVVGVTGTDGKTTTVSLIYHVLKESGKKTALISTVGVFIGEKKYDVGFHVTTPSPFGLQKYIKMAANEGCEYLILEITSHGLDQNRDYGINYKIGAITNVTHEHLDYHITYESYVRTKYKLLRKAKVYVLNADDQSYDLISKLNTPVDGQNPNLKARKLITYGMKNNSDICPNNFHFKTHLIGEFNKYNCLAAIAVCKELGIENENIKKAILSFKSPIGRQDMVYDKDFMVMIDFAHTPNAFKKTLSEVRSMTKGKLIHVFGSAGKRDISKRPLMGKISSEYSDIIVLTAEDPRGENVNNIIEEIKSGIEDPKFYSLNSKQIQNSNFKIHDRKYILKIPDRKKAIRFAISIADKGDFVFLTGKGHEKSMNYGKGEESWNEYKVVDESLKEKKNNL